MILLIDNYDSFSYNLFQLVGTINDDIKIIRNDEMTVDEIKELAPSHIILSPGVVGYIDLTGNLDTCIAIRLAYKKHSKVYVRSGAGIVADSVTVKEHNECINKAKAVMTALNASGEEE